MATLTPDLLPVLRDVQEQLLQRHRSLLRRATASAADREVLRFVLARLLVERGHAPDREARERLVPLLLSEVVGYGPLDPLLADDSISEVMVNGPEAVFVERSGDVERVPVRFRDEAHLLDTIQRMVAPLGRRLDYALPFADGHLPDGSRFHAIIAPLAVQGAVLTVRKFRQESLTLADLVQAGMLAPALARRLQEAVRSRLTVLVAGGTGAGKTTLMTALLRAGADPAERLVIVEDAHEVRLPDCHAVNLVARPPGVEGTGAVTIRDLVRNALRMRPDRLIVGEVRGPEAFDLLQALNTGHTGSLSTVHANGIAEALMRLETMAMMAAEQVPHAVIRQLVAATVDVVVQVGRSGGDRAVTDAAAVTAKDGTWQLHALPLDSGADSLPERVRERWLRRHAERAVRVFMEAAGDG